MDRRALPRPRWAWGGEGGEAVLGVYTYRLTIFRYPGVWPAIVALLTIFRSSVP